MQRSHPTGSNRGLPRNNGVARGASAACLASVLILTGCGGTSTPGAAAGSSASAVAHGSGLVRVLYAGSLVSLMQDQVGPAFDTASGYQLQGYGAGSTALANAIKGKVQLADVFISAAADADLALEGNTNGNWLSWYATFASAPLVIGYNPKSAFATDFQTMPWYKVLALPGIRLGRTDPTTDPKGKLTVTALKRAETDSDLPGFAAAVEAKALILPEESLVGRLEAGQLDAGFFYSIESEPQHIPTVGLGTVSATASFTVSILNRAADRAAAVAFVTYLLSPPVSAILRRDGFVVLVPRLFGQRDAVPPSLVPVVGRG